MLIFSELNYSSVESVVWYLILNNNSETDDTDIKSADSLLSIFMDIVWPDLIRI